MIGGDPEDLRALATRVRRWSTELDETASAVAAGTGIDWRGAAAERYRDRLASHAVAVAAARDEVDALGASLATLADALEDRQASIRRAEALVVGLVDDARRTADRLRHVADDVLTFGERTARDAAEGVLRTVVSLPLPGEPAWEGLAKQLGAVTR